MRILFVTRHLNKSGYEILRRLIQERFDLCGVLLKKQQSAFLNPWKRVIANYLYNLECRYYGCRRLKTTNSEILLAKSAGLNVINVNSIKSDNALDRVREAAPDIIVVGGGWHELIPASIFNFPRFGCINTHPSLLPNYRGTSITRWQILEGVEQSGCTIHYVNKEFDAGNILKQEKLIVKSNITPQELFGELSLLAADMMVDLLRQFEQQGRLPGIDVTDAALQAKYYSKWKWDDSKLKIDWKHSLQDVERFTRANTQESFRYSGPWFRTNQGEFLLRRAVLMPSKNRTESLLPVVVEQSEGILWLEKQNDPHTLGIIQVQRKDRFVKLRRACQAPNNMIIIE